MVAFTSADRRRRLVSRHHLGRTATDADAAVRAVAIQHSTDPTTPYLSARARVPKFVISDLESNLYERRYLIRAHTVRRTLFLIPTDRAPLFEAGAGRDVLVKERARLIGWLEASMTGHEIDTLLSTATRGALDALTGHELTTRQLTTCVPELGTRVTLGGGPNVVEQSLGSRLLVLLALEGLIVRTRPAGSWRSSQYSWARTEDWLGTPLPRVDEISGRVGILRDYLATHGPATMTDIRWWTGWTLGRVKEALAETGVESIDLEAGQKGLVLAGDTGHDNDPGPTVALLPGLDSTPMGWKERDWYMGPHAGDLFDSNGNAGPTVWVDGRAVGGWGQRPDGTVVFQILEEIGPEAANSVAEEAENLTLWLNGVVISPRFPSPLSRRL